MDGVLQFMPVTPFGFTNPIYVVRNPVAAALSGRGLASGSRAPAGEVIAWNVAVETWARHFFADRGRCHIGARVVRGGRRERKGEPGAN